MYYKYTPPWLGKKKDSKAIQRRMKNVKLPLFMDDIILNLENSKGLTEIFLETIDVYKKDIEISRASVIGL